MPTVPKTATLKVSSTEKVAQGHLTLILPMKSPADGEAVRSKLKSVMPDMYRAADAIGTIHYFRLIELDVKRFVFIAEYDGDLDTVLADIGKRFGPSFDAFLEHVNNAPATPVSNNVNAFVKWAKTQYLEPFTVYEAYPGTSVKKIKSLASNAGVTFAEGAGPQRPLLVIMPMKSRLSIAVVKVALGRLKNYLYKGADGVGTVHFARLVEFSASEVGFFTAYDGPFDKYAQDFASQLGPAFDLMFKFITDSPATPTSQHGDAFAKWVHEHDWCPIGFYNAYPGLSVQDVKGLLADA
jgi:hypothetical protein